MVLVKVVIGLIYVHKLHRPRSHGHKGIRLVDAMATKPWYLVLPSFTEGVPATCVQNVSLDDVLIEYAVKSQFHLG